MKKGILAALITIIVTLSTITVSASGETFEVSLDTGLDVYSIYMCYDVENQNVDSVNVVFADNVKGYGYSNYVDGKLWISIASGNVINCSEPLAQVSVKLSDGSFAVPDMNRILLRINGKEISDSSFIPNGVEAKKTDSRVEVAVNITDELLRKNITMYAAMYNSDGKMVGVKIKKLIPDDVQETYNVTFGTVADGEYVKVMFLKENYKPYTTPMICNISSGVTK